MSRSGGGMRRPQAPDCIPRNVWQSVQQHAAVLLLRRCVVACVLALQRSIRVRDMPRPAPAQSAGGTRSHEGRPAQCVVTDQRVVCLTTSAPANIRHVYCRGVRRLARFRDRMVARPAGHTHGRVTSASTPTCRAVPALPCCWRVSHHRAPSTDESPPRTPHRETGRAGHGRLERCGARFALCVGAIGLLWPAQR